jgi:tryptophanyl-tRNA synthetase
MAEKKRILTGDRPTGKLHLGHYVGSLKNRVELQQKYDTYILIADLQALTDNYEDPTKVHDNVRNLVIDYLSIGIDPNTTKIVIQSQVPELCELYFYYMNLVTLGRLQRNPTVKEELKQKNLEKNVPMGFLTYPVSQAADITGFDADLVPVGDDQLPMIEQTKEIVRRFNKLYGKTLKEPEVLLGDFPRLVGIDGQSKMGKSLGNAILLCEPRESLRRKVMSMYTDPNRKTADTPGKVEGNPIFTYHDAFNTNKGEVAELKKRYRAGKVGDVEVKERLFEALENFIAPIRERRMELEKNDYLVEEVMKAGVDAGREVAGEVLDRVKKAIGTDHYF